MKLLITFGCSWTDGVGVTYEPGMTAEQYKKVFLNSQDQNKYSFRSLLSKDLDLHNINFSCPGSSNQEQFRLAENFFATNIDYIKSRYQKIAVVWGITSFLRNEIYHNNLKMRKSFFYNDKSLLSKVIVTQHLDPQHEIELLHRKILFWNKMFDTMEVQNLWFDTFNHHDYGIVHSAPESIVQCYKDNAGPSWPSWSQFISGKINNVPEDIQNEILDPDRWEFHKYITVAPKRFFKIQETPRDLMSQLAIQQGIPALDNSYHLSAWQNDSNRVEFLVQKGILNPYSNHPTKLGHQLLAKMLSPSIEQLIN
jgi:hypothetical protein